MQFTCLNCQVIFENKYHQRIYCSVKCRAIHLNPIIKIKTKNGKLVSCYRCNKIIYRAKSQLKEKNYCSLSCRSKEVIKKHGFKTYAPLYPENRYKRILINKRRVYEHRYIMECHLGRKLTKNEHVHHINENPKDNRIENLKILTASEHGKLHKSKHD